MIALSEFVRSVTNQEFIPKVVDQIMSGNVLAMKFLRNAKSWRGGDPINIPVNVVDITTVGSYSGFDTLATTQENTRQRLQFNPSQAYVSVTLSGIQKTMNQGEAQVIDLIVTELDWRAKRLRDELGTEFYGDGTGNTSKDFQGLQNIVDDTTTAATYGGLSRTTYTNLRATRTAQSGSLSLANLAADFDAAQISDDLPTLAVCPPAVWTIYEALLTPTVAHNVGIREFRLTPEGSRPIDNISGNQGFRALAFRGVPVVSDDKCTAANLYFLNDNHLSFYRIPQPVGFTVESEKEGFGWTGWLQPVNQDAVTGRLQLYGQLISDSPRTMSRRTGISS